MKKEDVIVSIRVATLEDIERSLATMPTPEGRDSGWRAGYAAATLDSVRLVCEAIEHWKGAKK